MDAGRGRDDEIIELVRVIGAQDDVRPVRRAVAYQFDPVPRRERPDVAGTDDRETVRGDLDAVGRGADEAGRGVKRAGDGERRAVPIQVIRRIADIKFYDVIGRIDAETVTFDRVGERGLSAENDAELLLDDRDDLAVGYDPRRRPAKDDVRHLGRRGRRKAPDEVLVEPEVGKLVFLFPQAEYRHIRRKGGRRRSGRPGRAASPARR